MIPPLLISHCPTYKVPKSHNESSSSFFWVVTTLGLQYLLQFFMLNNSEKSSNLAKKIVKSPTYHVFCQKMTKKYKHINSRVLTFKNPNPISLKMPGFRTHFVGFRTCFATIDNSPIPQMHFYFKTNFFLLLFSAGRFKRKAT